MNPHGDCSTCAWHSRDEQKEYDGDLWIRWMCWRTSGCPEVRMETTTDRKPPACEAHLSC